MITHTLMVSFLSILMKLYVRLMDGTCSRHWHPVPTYFPATTPCIEMLKLCSLALVEKLYTYLKDIYTLLCQMLVLVKAMAFFFDILLKIVPVLSADGYKFCKYIEKNYQRNSGGTLRQKETKNALTT